MKRILTVLFAVSFIFILALNAFAVGGTLASRDSSFTYDSTLDRVVDNAGLLTYSEEAELEEKIDTIIADYSFDVVILTVNSLDGKTVESYADDYYDYNNYGYGTDADGLLFMLSMEDRDYYTSTRGKGITVFTNYGIEYISDKVVSELSDGDYYQAFSDYLDYVREFLDNYAEEGIPFDVDNVSSVRISSPFAVTAKQVIIILAVGFVVAFLIVNGMKKSMNTAVPNNYARAYLKEDTVRITASEDRFMFRTTARVPVQQNSSGGRGGSSTHVGSSGRSHGGGGGKF